MYMNFGVLHTPLPIRKFAFGELQNAWFHHVFLKSKLISIYDFWGCIEYWQGNYFLMFFPTDAGDFTCLTGFFSLMWEILHACRESGRNSVQAGDSLSMRESWKPWWKCAPHHIPWNQIPLVRDRFLKKILLKKSKNPSPFFRQL